MGRDEVPQPGGGDRGPGQDAARAEATYWRAVAEDREAALRAVTRRPLMRAVLGVDRRLEPARHRLGSQATRLRRVAARLVVLVRSLPATPARPRRRAGLARQLDGLPAPPGDGTVAVLDLSSAPASGITGAARAPVDSADDRAICLIFGPTQSPDPELAQRLAAALGDGVVAATPTLVHPDRHGLRRTEHDLLVRAQGFAIELDSKGAPLVVARSAGAPVDLTGTPEVVDAAPLQCLVVERTAYTAAGGLGPGEADLAAVDLCLRLRRNGGRIVHVPSALAFDARPVDARRQLRHPVDVASPGWRSLVERRGPAMAHLARRRSGPTGRRWAISTAAPSAKVAARWGDWHFAEALAEALRRLDQQVLVQTQDDADSLAARACDVHLVLHGLGAVRRTSGQRHLVWVISHPESVDSAMVDEADLLLVASPRFAEHLRRRTSTPIEVLLQATDPDRFRPGPARPEHRHDVTVVAKTRGVMRRAVHHALEAGIEPAIYGSGWRPLVDERLTVSDHVDNEVLAAVYRGAGVVLNDHWDTMRSWGFVSNRIFDVLACGTPVISDHVAEIHDLFEGAVPTFRTSTELRDLVATDLAHPHEARARAARGRALVLAEHTFDHRARQLLELLDAHSLGGEPL